MKSVEIVLKGPKRMEHFRELLKENEAPGTKITVVQGGKAPMAFIFSPSEALVVTVAEK